MKAVRVEWVLRMAWRDSRASRARLLAYGLSIVLGVAALVAVASLRDSLREAVEGEAKGLLGADLVVMGRTAFGEEEEALFERLGGEQAREVEVTTMAVFPATGDTRLVQVRAVEGGYPFYGSLKTAPEGARGRLEEEAAALVEESLLRQFGVDPGGVVRLGAREFVIAGALQSAPGEAAAIGALAPRVTVPLRELEATGLVRTGSFGRYKQYFRLPEGVDADAWMRTNREELRRLRLRADSATERREDLGQAMDHLAGFLNLAGFVALVLGAVGVGSAMALYVRPKRAAVATLRCLGAGANEAAAVYLVQAAVMGLAGAVVGALVGVAVQRALPELLADWLPFSLEARVSPAAVVQGLGVGLGGCLAAAAWPLMAVRKVSPLQALRADFGRATGGRVERVVGGLALVGVLVVLAAWQTGSWKLGFAFAAAIATGFGVLAGAAGVLMAVLRRVRWAGLGYPWRQGLANLHRPQNRTGLMLLALGLATFLVLSLFLVRSTLVADLARVGGDGRPDLIAWDVQPDQVEGVKRLLEREGLELRTAATVVTMRLAGLKGRSVDEILADRANTVPGWRLRREYRSSWRAEVAPTERLIAGEWVGRWAAGGAMDAPVPVSLERSMAEELGLVVGDGLAWDVQGVLVPAVVASIREVDWRGFQPNFYAVFPEGVLEGAPGFSLIAARAGDADASARFQRALGREYPGVSVIDLRLILETVDTIFREVGRVVRFLAGFTVGTGLVVLAGAVLAGRFQRIREAALLRTLGAGRRVVVVIQLVEWTVLGVLGAALGGVLAWVSAAVLTRRLFDVRLWPPVEQVVIAAAVVVAVTVALGWVTGRRVLRTPPLEVMREDR